GDVGPTTPIASVLFQRLTEQRFDRLERVKVFARQQVTDIAARTLHGGETAGSPSRRRSCPGTRRCRSSPRSPAKTPPCARTPSPVSVRFLWRTDARMPLSGVT